MTNIYSEFKENVLIPTLLSDGAIVTAFPDLKLTDRGTKYISPYHLDGKASSSKDQSYIYKGGSVFHDNNGNKIAVVDLYMQQNSLSFVEALAQLADIAKLELPKPDGADSIQWSEYRTRQTSLSESYYRMKEALFSDSPEAKKALSYLTDVRGYSVDTIKAMGLGYCSPDEAKALGLATKVKRTDSQNPTEEEKARYQKLNSIYGDGYESGVPYGVGTDFTLAIPYSSKGILRGLKFRYVTDEAMAKYGSQKYRNTKSLNGKMNSLPFGLDVRSLTDGEIVVAEGEIDALHAKAKGIKNIIATSGGSLSDEALALLAEVGVKRIIFIPDNDSKGKEFILEALAKVEALRLSAFVATLPDGKDTDEYLKTHSGEELRGLLDNAINSYNYRFDAIIDNARSRYTEDYLLDLHYSELEGEVITLINSITDEIQRENIIIAFADFSQNPNFREALKAKADRERVVLDELSQKNQTKDALQTALRLAEEGKVVEALDLMGDTSKSLLRLNYRDKYATLLADDTNEVFTSYQTKPNTIETPFQLYNGSDTYAFSLPSGGITIIGAPTNHGKSKMLQSLALHTATDGEEGLTLYLTYEERKEAVIQQLLNAYADVELTRQTSKHGNRTTIEEYLYNGSTRFMRAEAIEPFKAKEESFKSLLHAQSLKVIKPEDNYLSTLVGILRYILSQKKVKAVYLDYIQELYIEHNRNARTDELKEIMIDIDLIAQEYNIPIIIASQLNRDTDSPLSMGNQNIADSGWIERKASEILLIWSNKERCKNDPDGKKTKRVTEELPEVQIGLGGKLYAILTKSRYIPTGSKATLSINGNTGRVHGNKPDTPDEESEPFPQPTQTAIDF